MSNLYLSNGQSIDSAIRQAKCGDTLFLRDKIYNEKVEIKKSGITLVGVKGKTEITFGDCAKSEHKINYESNTFSSYTVGIFANDVTLCDLTIKNSCKDPKICGQAVALTVYGDNFKMEGCTLLSLQDTLFLGPLPDDLIARYDGFLEDYRRYYEGEIHALISDCKIFGSVDFIFGSAQAVFKNCDIVYSDDNRNNGYFIAPSHSLKQKYGFIFIDCRFVGDKNKTVYLARPWRDFGKCSFLNCRFTDVDVKLFDGWSSSLRYKTARFELDIIPKGAVSWARKISPVDLEIFSKL